MVDIFYGFPKRHRLFLIFTTLYLLIALTTYKDYGITFDEKVEYDSGKYLLQYFQKPTTIESVNRMINKPPSNLEVRQLPPFAVYSRIYPLLLNLLNPAGYFEWFHLLNILFGYLMFLFSYLTFLLLGRNPEESVIAPVMLFLTPYITGHIPANPKDIPFAMSYLASLYFVLLFSLKKYNEKFKILVLGSVFGLSISLRFIGLGLFVTNILYNIYKKNSFKNILLSNLLIFITSLAFICIFIPFVGLNVPSNFFALIYNAEEYSYWRGTIFYLGKYLEWYQRPWHYLFVLSLVKLPISTIILFIAGTATFIRSIFKKISITDFEFIFFFSIFQVIAAYLVTQPVVYNGIRHFLFLLLLITEISAFYFIKFLKVVNRKTLLLTIMSLYAVFTLIRMIILHPFEYVYFNEFTLGLKGAQHYFQLDYWGASYHEAALYIRNLSERDPKQKYVVYSCDSKFAVDYYSHLKYKLTGGPETANLIICDNFRDITQDIKQLNYPVVYEVKREGVVLNTVRLNPKPNYNK